MFQGENVGYTLFRTLAVLAVLFFIPGALKFTVYHLKLILGNKTTIGDLSHNKKNYRSEYDCGYERNMQQVFGKEKWAWPLPIYVGRGPLGDGINWITRK